MTDHYSTEQETKALIRPDTRTESEKQAAKLAEENWLNEQGMDMTFNESEKSQQRKVATGVTDGSDQFQMAIEMAIEAIQDIQRYGLDKILTVTPEGEFKWHENADDMIENGDYSNAPSIQHVLRALRESDKKVQDAVKAERESCAKLMDKLAEKDNLTNYFKFAANAIRERNTK